MDSSVHSTRDGSVRWPVLVFSEPIEAVPLLHVLMDPVYRDQVVRVQLANLVARRLLLTAKVCLMLLPRNGSCTHSVLCGHRRALWCQLVLGASAQLAHSQFWINCDVRPANIVVKGGVPVQVRAQAPSRCNLFVSRRYAINFSLAPLVPLVGVR